MPGLEEFPRRERLNRRKDFLAVYADGLRRAEQRFICYVARREGQGRKFGFAVSRKVGNAVARNRVKRFLREFYRTHRRLMPDDVYLVIVARPGCADLTYQECKRTMRRLFRQGGVLKDE